MFSVISTVLGTTRNTGSSWLARKTRRDCKQNCVAMFPKIHFHSAKVFFFFFIFGSALCQIA